MDCQTFQYLTEVGFTNLLQLVLANPVGSVAERMFNSAVGELFGSDRLFFSVAEAVAAGAGKAQP
jgi:sulfate transporter 3